MKKTKLISFAVFPLVLGLLVGCGNKPAPANEAKVKINEETKQMVKTEEGKGDALEYFKLSNVGLEAGDSLSFTYKGNLVDSQTYQAEPLALNNIDVVEVPVEVKFAVHNDVEDASINFWVYENNKYEVFVDGREEDPEPEVTYSFTIGGTSYEMVEDPTEPGLFGGSATLHKDDVIEFYEDEVKITSNIAVVSGENNLVPDNTGKFKVLFDYTPESALDMSVTLRVNSGTYNVWADGYQSPTPEPVYTMTMNDGTPVTLTIADDGKAEGVEHQYATNVGVLQNDSLKFYKDGELLTKIGADVDDNNNVANTESGMVVRTSYTPEEGYSVYLKLWQEDGGYSVWGVGYQQPGPQPTVPEYSMHGTADGQTWEDTPLTQSQGKETQYEVTNIDLTAGYTFVIQLAEGDWYNYNNVKTDCKDLVEKAAGESNDIVLKEEGTYNIYCDSAKDDNGIWIEKAGQPGPGPEPGVWKIVGDFCEWKYDDGIQMTLNGESKTEYTAEVDVEADEAIKITNGEDYINSWKINDGKVNAFDDGVAFVDSVDHNCNARFDETLILYYETSTAEGAKTGVFVTYKNVDTKIVGSVYADNVLSRSGSFDYDRLIDEGTKLQYKLLNVEIPDVEATLTMDIKLDDETIVITELEQYGAYKDFELSNDGKTLTYAGDGDKNYDFYLKESLENRGTFTLYVGYVAEPMTLYLNAGGSSLWDKDGAWFAIYVIDNETFVPMTEYEPGVYSVELSAAPAKFIMVRLKPSTDKDFDPTNDGLNWNNKWNQTNDIELVDGKDYITITGWGTGDFTYTTYSK